VTVNLATMLREASAFDRAAPAVSQRGAGGAFEPTAWGDFVAQVGAAGAFFEAQGIGRQERVAVWCGNSAERLVVELGIMASGRTSVPIFPGYPADFVAQLLTFSKVRALVVDTPARLASLPENVRPACVVVLSGQAPGASGWGEVIGRGDGEGALERFSSQSGPDDLAVIMFTSGTTNFPKGVMLTHGNILSQQAALRLLWKPTPGMRFLSYLPWHHSFGGLFERFFALSTGGSITLDDSGGRNIELMLDNVRAVRPHVFFSVPKIYAELMSRILSSTAHEGAFFHPELRFVFTAAAPLPLNVSDVFKARGVPVLEGWGLTETSPCCTLTSMSLERQPGVVGQPIPGVSVKIAEDGEILVKGPNIMRGYFDRPDLTAAAFDGGWFKTGDVGEVTAGGLKIVSRKDRIFKLGNGEKVFPTPIEDSLAATCRYVKHAYIFGSGQDAPLALLFPNNELLGSGTVRAEDANCERPRSVEHLRACLTECIDCMNKRTGTKINRVSRALIIDRELSVDRQELTPSFKVIPRSIETRFGEYMRMLEKGETELPEDAELIDLREPPKEKK
jgi:long-subunit acyl-CoA synthetase (AMP-forming)